MVDTGEPSLLAALASARVTPDPSLTQELVAGLRQAPAERPLVVTDLLDLRRAYFRRRAAVPIPAERRERVESGRELHLATAALLAPARFREVRVRREGIVGQIDLFEDRPVEIKTTAHPPPAGELARWRPAYIEQLGMYCALVDHPVGRLVLVEVDETERPTRVRIFDCRFASLDAILEEMRRRADLLRAAIRAESAASLPRCPWYQSSCEYRVAGACDCVGDEPAAGTEIADQVDGLSEDEAAGRQLTEALRSGQAAGELPAARRFRDLIYPRRAFFERTVPGEASAPSGPPPPMAGAELYRQMQELLESGPLPLEREAPLAGEPLERVACAGGRPLLVRTSRGWHRLTPKEIARERPQYLLELGLRAEAVNRSQTTLVVAYERASDAADRAEAFGVEFPDLGAWSAIRQARSTALARALRTGDYRSLPSCPGWMYDRCPYRQLCHCGPDSAGRDQP